MIKQPLTRQVAEAAVKEVFGKTTRPAASGLNVAATVIDEDDVTFYVKPGNIDEPCRFVCDHKAAKAFFAGVCAGLSDIVVAVCGHRP